MANNDKTLVNTRSKIDKAMQENLQLIPLIMDNIPQAVFWKDKNLVYLGCNQAFAEDAGLDSPEQIIGKTDFDMPWTDQADLYRADDLQVVDSGQAKINYEESQTGPTGETTWLRTSKIPVRDDSDQVVAVLGMYEDITEQKMAERTRHENEERLKAIYEGTNDAVMLLTPKGFFDCNPRTLDLFGFKTVEEFTKVHPADISPPLQPDGQESFPAAQKHIQTAYDQGSDRFEWVHRRTDGEDFNAEVLLSAFDLHGETVLQATVRDISDKKQTEESLKDSEQRFRTLFEKSADAYLIIDEGRFVDCNQATVEMLRASSTQEVLNTHPSELSPEYQPDGRLSSEKADEMMQIALEKGSNRFEWIHRRINGDDFPVEVLLTPITVDEKTVIHTVWRDISIRRRSERELQQEQALSEAVINGLPGVFYMFGTDGNLVRWNEEYAHVVGYNSEELASRNALDAIADEDKEITEAAIGRVFQEEQASVEANIITRDGRRIPYLFAGRRIQIGDQPFIVGTGVDIAERKLAEAQLERTLSETRLRYEVSQALAGAQTEDDVLDKLEQQVGIYPQAQVMFYTFDEQEDDVAVILRRQNAFESGMEFFMPVGTRFPAARFTLLNLLPADKPFVSNDFPAEEHLDPASRQMVEQGGVKSLAIFPLTVGSDRMGFLIAATRLPEYFDETKQNLYQALAELGTAALQTARLRDQIRMSFERRGYQVQVSTEISQEIAQATEIEDLFERVVTIVKERLGYYHTQLLQYDPTQDAVVLITGYGKVGQQMLAQGHRMQMGRGLIGSAAATGETLMRSDLSDDPDWSPNPLLPDTRGEIAVPIKLSGNVLGVLDVQSAQAGALTDDDRLLLEGLTGQIAIAIDQTRLRQEMSERLEEVNRLYRAMSRQGWEDYVSSTLLPDGFQFDQAGVRPIGKDDDGQSMISTPLSVPGGMMVGSLAVVDTPDKPLTLEERAFVQQVSEQVALALESARLFEQTQNSLAQTEGLYASSERIVRASSIDDALSAVVESTDLRLFERASILIYNRNWEDEPPDIGVVSGLWSRTGDAIIPRGSDFPIKPMPFATQMHPDESILINDVANDPRLDEQTRAMISGVGNSMAFFPLVAGEQWFGLLIAASDMPVSLKNESLRQIESLVGQAATVIQSIQLYQQAQSALAVIQESEARLAEALDIAHLGNFEYDVDNDMFIFNDHFYAIFHTTVEEVGSYKISSAQYAEQFVHPDDLPMVGTEIEKALTSKERHYSTTIEHRILYADGGEGYISVNVHVERDENGKIIRYYGANQDITERRQAEEAVRQAQERAQTILETVTLPMVITRLSDNILTFANEPAAEIVGMMMEEFVNQPAPNFYANPEERNKFVEELRAKGFVNNMQVQLLRGDQTPFWALLSARVFTYEGDPSILTTITDISERIQAQQATAKRAVELATVADIGTSISTVLEEHQLLETVVQQTRERFDLYHCHIFLADEEGQTLQVKACGWEEGSPHTGTYEESIIHTDQEQSLVAQAARNQRAVIVNDVRSDPNWLPNELLPETRSEMAIPLIAGNQVLGVLDVQAAETDRFTEEDISIMTTLASQAAVALQNTRTYARTQRQAEYEALINTISQRIQNTNTVENALQVAVRELGRALGASRASVQLGLNKQRKV